MNTCFTMTHLFMKSRMTFWRRRNFDPKENISWSGCNNREQTALYDTRLRLWIHLHPLHDVHECSSLTRSSYFLQNFEQRPLFKSCKLLRVSLYQHGLFTSLYPYMIKCSFYCRFTNIFQDVCVSYVDKTAGPRCVEDDSFLVGSCLVVRRCCTVLGHDGFCSDCDWKKRTTSEQHTMTEKTIKLHSFTIWGFLKSLSSFRATLTIKKQWPLKDSLKLSWSRSYKWYNLH